MSAAYIQIHIRLDFVLEANTMTPDQTAPKIHMLFFPTRTVPGIDFRKSANPCIEKSMDPDEMQQNAAFLQGLYCLLR